MTETSFVRLAGAALAAGALAGAPAFAQGHRENVVWHNWSSRLTDVWVLCGAGESFAIQEHELRPARERTRYQLVGVGDLNGDARDDLLWRQLDTGQLLYIRLNGLDYVNQFRIYREVGPEWSVVGVGDVDGDGTDDIVWEHENGRIHYWRMQGGERVGAADIHQPVGPQWDAVAVGDVTGDGTADIIFQRDDGQVHFWRMSGGERTASNNVYRPVGSEWELLGAGDLSGDGVDDILWLNRSASRLQFWEMREGQRVGYWELRPPFYLQFFGGIGLLGVCN